MEPHWLTPADQSTRGKDLRGFSSCPTSETLQSLVHRPAKQRTDRQYAHADQNQSQRWWDTSIRISSYLLDPLCRLQITAYSSSQTAGKGKKLRALTSFLQCLLEQLLSLPLHFGTATLWVSNLQRKTFKLFRKLYQVIPNPKGNKKKTQTDACKLGFKKQGRVGTACLSLFTLNSIRKPYSPWIKKEINFQCRLWDRWFIR